MKAACGRTARAVWAADGGQRLTARLLRPDCPETGFGEMENLCAESGDVDHNGTSWAFGDHEQLLQNARSPGCNPFCTSTKFLSYELCFEFDEK